MILCYVSELVKVGEHRSCDPVQPRADVGAAPATRPNVRCACPETVVSARDRRRAWDRRRHPTSAGRGGGEALVPLRPGPSYIYGCPRQRRAQGALTHAGCRASGYVASRLGVSNPARADRYVPRHGYHCRTRKTTECTGKALKGLKDPKDARKMQCRTSPPPHARTGNRAERPAPRPPGWLGAAPQDPSRSCCSPQVQTYELTRSRRYCNVLPLTYSSRLGLSRGIGRGST